MEGADPSSVMASEPDKEEKQPHTCTCMFYSVRLRTRRDFESSSDLSLSHTKSPAMWAGKHVKHVNR